MILKRIITLSSILIVWTGLAACGHSTTKDSHSASSSSSNKVVKHSHKKKTQTAETSVSSSVLASQNVQPSPASTRTDNGWLFSGDGYTATVDDNGSISHN